MTVPPRPDTDRNGSSSTREQISVTNHTTEKGPQTHWRAPQSVTGSGDRQQRKLSMLPCFAHAVTLTEGKKKRYLLSVQAIRTINEVFIHLQLMHSPVLRLLFHQFLLMPLKKTPLGDHWSQTPLSTSRFLQNMKKVAPVDHQRPRWRGPLRRTAHCPKVQSNGPSTLGTKSSKWMLWCFKLP